MHHEINDIFYSFLHLYLHDIWNSAAKCLQLNIQQYTKKNVTLTEQDYYVSCKHKNNPIHHWVLNKAVIDIVLSTYI